MVKKTKQQINDVKAQGFLINRNTELFSGRIVPKGTTFSCKDLATISEISKKFGHACKAIRIIEKSLLLLDYVQKS